MLDYQTSSKSTLITLNAQRHLEASSALITRAAKDQIALSFLAKFGSFIDCVPHRRPPYLSFLLDVVSEHFERLNLRLGLLTACVSRRRPVF